MESVSCICRKCRVVIDEYTNLWTQIGTSYSSPIIHPETHPGIQLTGTVRSGEKGTLVEGCQLQDIACVSCRAILGIQCRSTPGNHVLVKDQLLLKLSAILSLDRDGRREVDLVVKRHLKLRDTSKSSSGRSRHGTPQTSRSYEPAQRGPSDYYTSPAAADVAELSQLHAEIEAQRGDIDRIDSEGYKVVSALNDAVSRVEAGLSKVEATLAGLRREISDKQEDTVSLKTEIQDFKKRVQSQVAGDRIVINRLEDQIKAANTNIGTLRQDLTELTSKLEHELGSVKAGLRQNTKDIAELKPAGKDRVSIRDHAKDMAGMRAELAQLRKQMEDGRARPAGPFPSRELDILTSNISKIGNRANQVESLQMEFEMFKGRVERIEATAQAQTQVSSQVHPAPISSMEDISPYDRYDDHDFSPRETRSSRRKRSSVEPDTSPVTRQKRTARSSQAGSTVAASSQWSGNPPTSPPSIATGAKTGVARTTRGAKTNKRTPRTQKNNLTGATAEPHVKRRG